MTRESVNKYGPSAIMAGVGLAVAFLAASGFETTNAHAADMRAARQEQEAIHAEQQRTHDKELERIVCLLQEIQTPTRRVCP